jgi:Lamin Tail Domain
MPRTLLFVALVLLLLMPSAAIASTSGVVVSQIYGGGGNSGATFRNDYVELFNAGSTAVDISGWTVQYTTAVGTTWQTTALSGSIGAGRHFLVGLASNGAVGSPLPTPDATGTSNLAATSGKVALVRGAAALTCGASAGSCSSASLVEDLVGYGDATDFEGSGSAPAPSNTLAAERVNDGCADTNDNAADFAAAAPSPQNSAAPPHACEGTPSPGGGDVRVDVDIASALSVTLDRASLSFGATSAGATPTPLAENVTVSSNNSAGYSLAVRRTAFSPNDLPLAIGATAPSGASLASTLAGGALAPIPVQPAAPFTIGTRDGISATAGDVWPARIGFSSPLPLVATGRYASTVTFTVIAR